MTYIVVSFHLFYLRSLQCFEETHHKLSTKVMFRNIQREKWRERMSKRGKEREKEECIWHPELVCLCVAYMYISNALLLDNSTLSRLCGTSFSKVMSWWLSCPSCYSLSQGSQISNFIHAVVLLSLLKY